MVKISAGVVFGFLLGVVSGVLLPWNPDPPEMVPCPEPELPDPPTPWGVHLSCTPAKVLQECGANITWEGAKAWEGRMECVVTRGTFCSKVSE